MEFHIDSTQLQNHLRQIVHQQHLRQQLFQFNHNSSLLFSFILTKHIVQKKYPINQNFSRSKNVFALVCFQAGYGSQEEMGTTQEDQLEEKHEENVEPEEEKLLWIQKLKKWRGKLQKKDMNFLPKKITRTQSSLLILNLRANMQMMQKPLNYLQEYSICLKRTISVYMMKIICGIKSQESTNVI